jgi:hypothetical protein
MGIGEEALTVEPALLAGDECTGDECTGAVLAAEPALEEAAACGVYTVAPFTCAGAPTLLGVEVEAAPALDAACGV